MHVMDQQLAQFAKGSKTIKEQAQTAVMYTRVSTKEQANNNQSLFTQEKHIRQYAMNNDLQIIGEFGGTYESAKSDERKQFQAMIAFVKRHKVDAIIVYSVDRFSRSGPNAIYISEQLRQLGIQIISVTQPVDATTASGELQQSIYFIFSQYENNQRRLKSMAGTKEKLLKGHWVTKAPFGYKSIKQGGKKEIIITEEGIILATAFRRKIKYNHDFTEISRWLKQRGVNLSNKRLSEMARNVFYCGYLVHKALDGEIVKGNHQGIITRKEFLQLNDLLQKRPVKKLDPGMAINLPLKGHMHCSKCNKPMTGYYVRPKNLFYYKCNTKGCKVNRSAKMLNDRWEQALKVLQLESKYIAPMQDHIKFVLESLKDISADDVKILRKRRTELEQKIEALEERYALGEINKVLFDKYSEKFRADLVPIREELSKMEKTLSNPTKHVKNAVEFMSKIQTMWQLSNPEGKSKLLKTIYPKGILFDTENNSYRTSGLNPAIRCMVEMVSGSRETKKRNSDDKLTYSALVARSRIELPTSGL